MLLADVYVVSKDLIDRAMRMLEESYTEKIRAAGPGAIQPVATDTSAESESGKKKKGGRGGTAEKGETKEKSSDLDEVHLLFFFFLLLYQP